MLFHDGHLKALKKMNFAWSVSIYHDRQKDKRREESTRTLAMAQARLHLII